MAAFPGWRGLNHFETVMNISFNDGSKHEDIAKMMLFAAHNVFVDDAGLLLLQALRSYLEYRTSLSLQVHTSETIADGCREVLTLDTVMKVQLISHSDFILIIFRIISPLVRERTMRRKIGTSRNSTPVNTLLTTSKIRVRVEISERRQVNPCTAKSAKPTTG